jgi:hypothetical protein
MNVSRVFGVRSEVCIAKATALGQVIAVGRYEQICFCWLVTNVKNSWFCQGHH